MQQRIVAEMLKADANSKLHETQEDLRVTQHPDDQQ